MGWYRGFFVEMAAGGGKERTACPSKPKKEGHFTQKKHAAFSEKHENLVLKEKDRCLN